MVATFSIGKNSISRLISSIVQDTSDDYVLSTGIIGLDLILNGGLHSGTITEVFGLESSGKTSLVLSIARNLQIQGKTVCIVDDEYSITSNYALSMGINPDTLLLAHPTSGEQTIVIAEELISSGAIDLLVIDSLAGIVSAEELVDTMFNSNTMLQFNIITKVLEKLRQLTREYGIPIIVTNQLRTWYSRDSGKSIRTIASSAARKFADVIISVSTTGNLYKHIDHVGSKITIQSIKGSDKSSDMILFFGTGISNHSSLLLLDKSPIKKSGTWYIYDNKQLGQGLIQSIATLEASPKLYDEILSKVGI